MFTLLVHSLTLSKVSRTYIFYILRDLFSSFFLEGNFLRDVSSPSISRKEQTMEQGSRQTCIAEKHKLKKQYRINLLQTPVQR